jgi:Putative beta barrel porin-7 (BBP7)
VARASDLVNRALNPTQIPSSASFGRLVGPPVPAPIVQQADFWAHSLNLGLVVNF